MLWNRTKSADKAFQEWKLMEQKARVEGSYQEADAIHSRVKSRLFSLLSLSTPLCSASFAGAYSGKGYEHVCTYMAAGFLLVIGSCILGLFPSRNVTAHIGPEAIDRIMSLSPAVHDKAEGQRRMITYFDKAALFNLEQAKKDRRYLRAAWVILFLTPLLSALAAIL